MLEKQSDGFVARYINRRFSKPLTMFIVNHDIPITPNQVSVISFLIGVFGAFFLFVKHPILGAILIQVSSIIDGVDGELARARGESSELGAFFDSVLDRFVDILAVLGVIYLASDKIFSSKVLTILALLALSGTLMVSYLHAVGERSLKVKVQIVGRIRCFASRDVRLFVTFVGVILGFFVETLIILSILTNLYVVVKFIDILTYVDKSG